MSRIEIGKIELEFTPTDLCAVFDGIRDLFSEQMKQKEMDFFVSTSQVKNRYVWCDRKNLNRELAQIPIVVMTANAFAEDIRAFEEAGMNRHIAKPVDINKMVQSVAAVLRKS